MSVRNNEQTIEPGFWVAMTLHEGIAPLRCYVGQVQAVDNNGIRITLIDRLAGVAAGYDLFATWNNVQAALIATPDHDLEAFGQRAAKWQNKMNGEQEVNDEAEL